MYPYISQSIEIKNFEIALILYLGDEETQDSGPPTYPSYSGDYYDYSGDDYYYYYGDDYDYQSKRRRRNSKSQNS